MFESQKAITLTDRLSLWCFHVWKGLYSQQTAMSQQDGRHCLSQEGIDKTCVYWAGTLISYRLVSLKPDTAVCLPCAHIVSVCFSLLYTSSLSASTMKSSCFSALPMLSVLLRCLASIVSASPIIKSCRSPKVTAGSASWYSWILYQRQRAAWLLRVLDPNRFSENMGDRTNGWWIDDGCSGTIRLVSVMNLFHLIRCMEPIRSDTLQIALYYNFLIYYSSG